MVIRIQTRDNEPVEKALRRLRKLCNNEGVTRTSKAKAYFEKPSERRRRDARERRKAIRLSMRAKRQDVAKLLSRRRKARKNARAAAREAAANEARANQAPENQENVVNPQVDAAVNPAETTTPTTPPITATEPVQVNTPATESTTPPTETAGS